MRHIKTKIFQTLIFSLVAILAMPTLLAPKASATDNDYFYVTGSTLLLDELNPPDEDDRWAYDDYNHDHRFVKVEIKAARALTLRNIEGAFTPLDADDEELSVDFWSVASFYPTPRVYHGNEDTGTFCWNKRYDYCYSAYSGLEGDRSFTADETVFSMTYYVDPDVTLLSRNMPVTITSATIVDGSNTTTVEDLTFDAEINVQPSTNYYTIDLYKEGNGTIIAPRAVAAGAEAEIKIIPDDGNELLYVEFNDRDVTDQVENNVIRTIMTENLDVEVVFRPVYNLISGDGGSHTLGTEGGLDFVVDKDPTTYDSGNTLARIDNNWIVMDEDCIVNPITGTITITHAKLETLSVGSHKLEIFFFDTSRAGIVRANFTIIAAEEEADITDSTEDEAIGLPNTGQISSEKGSSEIAGVATIVAIISVLSVSIFIKKKTLNRKEN